MVIRVCVLGTASRFKSNAMRFRDINNVSLLTPDVPRIAMVLVVIFYSSCMFPADSPLSIDKYQ